MITSAYRYAVIEPDRSLRLRTGRLPCPADHEVLLRVAYCGICATDLAILDGKRSKTLPYLPGHEYAGVVEQVGALVTSVRPGDRVVGNPNAACGDCYVCRHGQANLCDAADIAHYSNGAFADGLTIDARYVHRIPARLSSRDAVLTEPLACAIHAAQQARRSPQTLALVIGGGPIGLLVAEAARQLDLAETIMLSERSAERRSNAEQLGVRVVDALPATLDRQIRSINPLGADLVFECSGSVPGVETALSCVRRGGAVVLVGRTAEDAGVVVSPCRIARQELTLLGSSRYQPQHFAQALDWLSQGVITTAAYFDRVFALDDLPAAFEHARGGRSIKTLVAP